MGSELGYLVYRISWGMSSRGVARTKSRDSVTSIAYPAAETASHVQDRPSQSREGDGYAAYDHV
jgi:hypothetical protein